MTNLVFRLPSNSGSFEVTNSGSFEVTSSNNPNGTLDAMSVGFAPAMVVRLETVWRKMGIGPPNTGPTL